jgi:hypothetical protein
MACDFKGPGEVTYTFTVNDCKFGDCETDAEKLKRLEREIGEVRANIEEKAKPKPKTRGEEVAESTLFYYGPKVPCDMLAKVIDDQISYAKSEQRKADAKIVEHDTVIDYYLNPIDTARKALLAAAKSIREAK